MYTTIMLKVMTFHWELMTSYRHVYPSIQARESIIAPFKLSIVVVSAMEKAQDQKKVESTIM